MWRLSRQHYKVYYKVKKAGVFFARVDKCGPESLGRGHYMYDKGDVIK